VRDVAREVLVFLLDEEEYGVDILTVQEIRGYENVTSVPGVPAHVKGVMDLRGVIVPVVDLRVRFGRADPGYDALTVVIILELPGRVVGMVVDGVSDVVQLQAHEIKPAPEVGSTLGGSFLREVAVKDGRMLLLADIAKLVATHELDLLDAA
jgi:purine-binding chemotaxis protein CheW